MKNKDIVLIPVLAVIIVIQKELLSFIPNVSFTMLLISVYSVVFERKKSLMIVLIYVILDALIYGSFSTIYTPLAFIGWAFTPLLLKRSNYLWANVITSFLYEWIYVIPSCLLYNMSFVSYMVADIPYEIIFVVTNFITILLLGKPLIKVLDKLSQKGV